MQGASWLAMFCKIGVKGSRRFNSSIKEDLVKAVKLRVESAT